MSAVNLFQKAIITIRNVLRGDSITGMDSMRHICIYIVSRYMTIERAKTIGLPMEYAWENMICLLKVNGGPQKLYDIFRLNDDSNSFMQHLDRLFGTFDFTFSISSPEIHSRIMTIMNEVDMDMTDCEIDILGWVYEQHLRTGASAARDLGQFFTNRAVCKYMVDLCDPRIKEDGTPETVCDPTMGTGGFITTAIKHYDAIMPHIDWRKYVNAVHGCDSDSKVAAIARMNVFMETKGARAENMMMRNSLYDGLPLEQYDVIVANPPFGLHEIDYSRCCSAIRNIEIAGAKSEPLFLQLVMASLAPGGRAAIILPTTFLDMPGAQFINTRRYLIEKFHVTHIIGIGENTFMNTKVDTSIIVFVNDEYSTGYIDIMRISNDSTSCDMREEVIGTLAHDDIEQSSDCSLDLRRYTVQFLITEPSTPEHVIQFERMRKLDDVCHLIHGVQISPKLFKSEGLAVIKQKNISSGKLVLSEKQDYVPRDIADKHIRPVCGDIVVSTAYDCGRCARVDAPGWITSSDTYIIRAIDPTQLSPLYLFWYLYSGGFYEIMQTLQRGSGVKHIRSSDIKNTPIYVPPMEEQFVIIDKLVALSARFDEIRAQVTMLQQEINQLPIRARSMLNPLFADTQTSSSSQTRTQRDILPHM